MELIEKNKGGDSTQGREPLVWGIAALIFGFYPVVMTLSSILDGSLYFDLGEREAVLGIQVFEWSATVGFLLMGGSLLAIGAALLMGRHGALRAQDYWALASAMGIVAVASVHSALTGTVQHEVALVYLMYPGAVGAAWLLRWTKPWRGDSNWYMTWWGASVVGVVGAFGILLVISVLAGSSDGTVRSQGGSLGDWTLEVSRCQSGQTFSPAFEGVQLTGQESAPALRIAQQAGEDWVLVYPPRSAATAPGSTPEGIRLDLEGCTEREVLLERSKHAGVRREGQGTVFNLSGHLKLDCDSTQGQFRAQVHFENCTYSEASEQAN